MTDNEYINEMPEGRLICIVIGFTVIATILIIIYYGIK
jgi:hypothetical protein